VAFQLRDSQQVSISVEALDSEGNPAAVTVAFGPSTDETVVAVTDNGDGTALVVASPGAGGLGNASVPVTVTDKSDGDVISSTFDVEVIAGDAVAVNVLPGTPEDKPVA
jgi:hypothetical protein